MPLELRQDRADVELRARSRQVALTFYLQRVQHVLQGHICLLTLLVVASEVVERQSQYLLLGCLVHHFRALNLSHYLLSHLQRVNRFGPVIFV